MSVNPASFLAEGDLALDLEARGELEKAIDKFQRAYDLNPGFNLSSRNLGSALVNYGLTDRALSFFSQHVSRYPKDFDARLGYGENPLINLHRYEEAQTQLDAAIKLNPNDAGLQGNYGILLWQRGNHKEGLEHVRLAVRMDPKAKINRDNLQKMELAVSREPANSK